jgi:exopolysaccharide production protein ExoZ
VDHLLLVIASGRIVTSERFVADIQWKNRDANQYAKGWLSPALFNFCNVIVVKSVAETWLDLGRRNILIIFGHVRPMSIPKAKSQLRSIQILRGLAALLVVLVHAINSADYRSAPENGGIGQGAISLFLNLNNFGACGVDLFFVISGFVMALIMNQQADRSMKDFAWNRFVRIFPFFWIVGTAYIGFSYLIGLSVTSRGIFNTFLLLPVSDLGSYSAPTLVVGWSLAFELVFYMMVAVCVNLVKTARYLALIALLFSVAMCGLFISFPIGILSIIFNPIMLEFAFGVGVYMAWERYRNDARAPSIGLYSLLLGLALVAVTICVDPNIDARHLAVVDGSTGLKRSLVWGLPWALVVIGMVLREASFPNPSALSRFMSLTGDASYAIYLVHMFVCMYAERAMDVSAFNGDILVLSLCGASILSGIALHFWVEKPVIRIVRNIVRPRTAPRQAKPVIGIAQ